ncbi:MAG: asparaginase, partial [Acidobacteriota bacterium]
VTGMGAVTDNGVVGVAVKVEDGSERARVPVTVEVAALLHLLDEASLARVRKQFPAVLTNHRGLEVGSIQVNLPGGGCSVEGIPASLGEISP